MGKLEKAIKNSKIKIKYLIKRKKDKVKNCSTSRRNNKMTFIIKKKKRTRKVEA